MSTERSPLPRFEIGSPPTSVSSSGFTVEMPKLPDFGCTQHEVDVDRMEIRDDEIYAYCRRCPDRIHIPELPGGVNFERAGSYVGRAMALDDGDSDRVGQLLADLITLEKEITQEITKLERAQKLVSLARDMAKERMIREAKEPIE